MEAHPAHNGVRGEHPSFFLASAGDIGFALRTTLAGLAALYTAMWLQLDVPRWAIWTVLIVSPPVRGNTLRKTGARLVGTAIGCVVGVAIVALFPQSRVGFYGMFSLWLGACAYWATLRRGYVSYAASLGAFTSAIVSAGVSAQPLEVWQAAVDRGSATVLGVLFALVASNVAAGSDDVPGDLAKRTSAIAADLLAWAVKQLQLVKSNESTDAPFTAKILGLDEACSNAIAERPALARVKPWIQGLPTALLALQTEVLGIRDAIRRGKATIAQASLETQMLQRVADFLRSGEASELPSLRRQRASLTDIRQTAWGQTPNMKEIVDAILYMLAGLEAILTLSPPDAAPAFYPKPKFVAHPRYATTNLIRTFVGMAGGFIIWDVTAWAQGPVFMVNVAVALVIFVTLEDPVFANWANIIGTTFGGLIGLALKYLLVIRENDPLNLMIALFPMLFLSAWIETKGKLAPLGLFLAIGVLILIEPKNPQEYDFVHDVNTLVAIEFAYVFISVVFVAIGAPRKGVERVTELLVRMRQRRQHAGAGRSRQQRLWSMTQMYDELQRLQAVTNDPRHRQHGTNLVISELWAPQTVAAAAAGQSTN